MARKATSGGSARSDENYNARRRYIRSAQKWLDKAENSVGATASRYRELARDATAKAAELYERKADIKRSKTFQKLSKELGINVEEFRKSKEPTEREQARLKRLKEESKNLVSSRKATKEQRLQNMRDAEARIILNSNIGSRVYGGLADIWTKEYEDEQTGEVFLIKSINNIDAAIMEYFNVTSMMDVLEILESEFDIYIDPESREMYDELSLAIANWI